MFKPRTGACASAIYTIPRDGRKRIPAHDLLHNALLLVDVALKYSLVWLHLPAHGARAVSDFDHIAFAEALLLRAVIRHLLRRVYKGGYRWY